MLFTRVTFHIFKDSPIHAQVTPLHFQHARTLSSPYSYLFYNQIYFHLSIERGLMGQLKHVSCSSHCAFLQCPAIYLPSYTYVCLPCWIRATRKNVNILKPIWVNHEQLSPNILYTVFKMRNWVRSASIGHVALFRSLSEWAIPYVTTHACEYLCVTLKFTCHELSRELSSTIWVFSEFSNESKTEHGPRGCAEECQGTLAAGFFSKILSLFSTLPQSWPRVRALAFRVQASHMV